MKCKRRPIGLLFCLVLFAAGCAQVPKEAGFNDEQAPKVKLIYSKKNLNLFLNIMLE